MRPWKKWLLRLLPVLALPPATFFGYRAWVHAEGMGRVNAIRAKLDAADPGWRLPDLEAARVRALPPDEQNMLKLALKAKAAIPPAFEEFQKEYDAANGWLNEDEEINRLPRPAALAAARRARTACRAAIDLAYAASVPPTGGVALDIKPNPISTVLPHLQELRTVGSLLRLNGNVAAADRDAAEAVRSCRAELRLARALSEEPTLISTLVRIAIANAANRAAEQLLAYTEPTDGLAELQDEFAREAEADFLAAGLRGERAMQDALFQWLEEDPARLHEIVPEWLGSDGPSRGVAAWLFRIRIPDEHAAAVAFTNGMLDIVRLPTNQWTQRIDATRTPDRIEHPLAGLLCPAYGKVIEARLRAMAVNRATAAAIACERFRQANGRWPKDLAEIPTTILKAIPNDPFTGRPLLYRVEADGVKVYSTGPDGADNEGNLTSRTVEPGHDIGIRLWSPEHRRAAPPPPVPEVKLDPDM